MQAPQYSVVKHPSHLPHLTFFGFFFFELFGGSAFFFSWDGTFFILPVSSSIKPIDDRFAGESLQPDETSMDFFGVMPFFV